MITHKDKDDPDYKEVLKKRSDLDPSRACGDYYCSICLVNLAQFHDRCLDCREAYEQHYWEIL